MSNQVRVEQQPGLQTQTHWAWRVFDSKGCCAAPANTAGSFASRQEWDWLAGVSLNDQVLHGGIQPWCKGVISFDGIFHDKFCMKFGLSYFKRPLSFVRKKEPKWPHKKRSFLLWTQTRYSGFVVGVMIRSKTQLPSSRLDRSGIKLNMAGWNRDPLIGRWYGSKVVSTHRTGTHPKATFTNSLESGIPFIIG